MKNLPVFLAIKYLIGTKREKSISTMVIVCFLGIFIGSFSLALIVSIMNGFEKVTHEKIKGVNPQILLHANGDQLNFDAISKAIKKDFPQVKAIAPTSIKQIIVQSDFSNNSSTSSNKNSSKYSSNNSSDNSSNNSSDNSGNSSGSSCNRHYNDQYSIALLKAIDPKLEPGVCNFEKSLSLTTQAKNSLASKSMDLRTKNSLKETQDIKTKTGYEQAVTGQTKNNIQKIEEVINKNNVIIGKEMAENLNVKIGDQINLFFSSEQQIRNRKIKLEQETAIVKGIFKSGLEEYDNSLIICDYYLFKKIFPETGITQIGLQLESASTSKEEKIIKQLKEKFGPYGITCYSWKELYPALVEALKLEKYAMFIILALITLVASMNIISLLFMQIIQKRPDIAILKAMGMSDSKISKIFLYLGMSISLTGATLGLFFAFIAGLILEKYPIIKLPDAYYVTYLPAQMDWQIFVTVFFVVLILGFLSTWIPIKKTKKINISQVLRFES